MIADQRAATTFYDRDAVRITDKWLSVGDRRYRIDRLGNLRRTRGPADRISKRAAWTAAASLPGPFAIGISNAPPVVVAIVGACVILAAALAIARAQLRPAVHQLWADHEGIPVRLYQTRDAVEFGKFSRALVRSVRAYGQRA